MRLFLVVAVLCATSAAAQGRTMDGTGRITVQGGFRYTPNAYFADKAAQAGTPYSQLGLGGVQGNASFGYGAFEYFELAVDVFVAWDQFKIEGYEPFSSVTYGGLLGLRLTRNDWPIKGLVPHLAIQVGPVLSIVNSSTLTGSEKLQTGYAASGGVTWRFADRFGLTFDVRFLSARHFVADIAGMNVGGLMFSIGFTTYFAPPPKTESDLSNSVF